MEKSQENYLKDLHSLWLNFVHEENDEKKEHWLQLFLFKYQLVDREVLKCESFLKGIPSNVCSYMLELVYDIISEAIESDIAENLKIWTGNVEECDKNLLITRLLEDKFKLTDDVGPSQLIVAAPSDITAILSLRKFLTHGLGNHILDFLSLCDISAITSKRNLVVLLINLFPNSPWDTNISEYQSKEPISLEELINTFSFVDQAVGNRSVENIYPYLLTSVAKCSSVPSFNSTDSCDIAKVNYIVPVSYDLMEFKIFKSKVKTSDEIAEILIELLNHFVKEESGLTLNENSVTIESLKFALDTFCNIQYSNAFGDRHRSFLKLKLLSLIFLCLNNLFSRSSNVDLFDLKKVFEHCFIFLQSFVEENSNEFEKIAVYACIFLAFGLLLNILVIFPNKSEIIADIIKMFSKDNINLVTNFLNMLTKEKQIQNEEFLKKVVKLLLTLINTAKFRECKRILQKNKRQNKRKQQLPKCQQFHCKGSNLPCLFEQILLKTLSTLTPKLQENVISHFRRNGLCCCSYTSDILSFLFENNYDTQMQKSIYKFICCRILKTIFLKSGCELCEAKMKSVEFHEKFFKFYKEKYLNISESSDIRIYLKHLLKISNLITTDILANVLTDIVLPVFYNEIRKEKPEKDLNVILECLNVIINYLTDTRMINIFYDEQNLKYVREILYIPELCKVACDLIRIGVIKARHSGCETGTQESLASKLITMHLDATENITRKVNDIFFTHKVKFKTLMMNGRKIANNSNFSQIDCPYTDSLSIAEIFHLASVFWSFTLELFKANEQFRTCFQMKYPTVSDLQCNEPDVERIAVDCALFQLAYNTWITFLYQRPQNELTCHILDSTNSDTSSDSPQMLCDGNGTSVGSCATLKSEETIQDYLVRLNSVAECGECTQENINITFNLIREKRDKIFTEDISLNESFIKIITKSYSNDDSVQSDFLEKLKSSGDNIIFDIKNQSNSGSYYINQSEENTQHDILTSGLRTINWILSSGYTLLFGNSEKYDTHIDEKVSQDSNSYPYVNENENSYMLQLISCRKSLIKLFEYSFAVFIMENDQNEGTRMSLYLRKLKDIVLIYSKSKDESNAGAVIQALQSLLKVAEIAQRPNNLSKTKQPSIILNRESGEGSIVNASQDSEVEFHSSKMSFSQLDSETELSENETEEYYFTADEGYQADAELPEISEADEEIHDIWNPYLPSSRYRSLIAHDGICKIIIEILIELSTKCIEDPAQWSSSLSQLANRLYVVREYIGSPLFLLKGFAPILKSNNIKLRDFQQSILDLITDLNSPESLCAFLEILGTHDSPSDILIKYMSYICINNIIVQPSAELLFPVKNDEYMSYTCNPLLFEQIKQLRNYHKLNNLQTPLTEAPVIIPLVHNKLWHDEGFTLSTWVRANSYVSSKTSQNDNGENNANSGKQIHLISIGSNQVLFSIYINEELTLTFETNKPNQEIQRNKEPKLNIKPKEGNSQQESFCLKRKRKFSKKLSKELEVVHEDTNKENILNNAESQTVTKDKVVNAFQCTKQAILNSFSQFQIFSSSSRQAGDTFEKSSVELKYFRLPRKKWIHLCFAVVPKPKELDINMIIDGTEQYVISLPCNVRQIQNLDSFQVICVGHCLNDPSAESFLEYGLSNLILFHKCVSDKSILANLTALGPNCTNLTNCQVGNNVPNYALLNFNKTFNLKISNFGESIRYLKEALIASYSAHEPGHIVGFEKDTDGSTLGCINGLVMFGTMLQPNLISSIQTSVFLNGGLSCLLFLFAKAVETNSDPVIQALALDILLCVARSDSCLYTEFIKKDYLDLIGYVIRTERCTKDVALLKSIINNACTQNVISKRTDCVQIMENTTASVIHPNFIVNVIRRYSDWYRPGSKDSTVLDTLLACIRAIIRDKHPHQSFNVNQLMHAGLIRELLNLCKVYIIESPAPIYISEESAKSFVCILNTFAGSPPSPSLLDEIMKLLLLFQKPSECFIIHDRSKFYFLISPEPPLKHKKISLPLPSKHMKHIMRERKRTAPASVHNVEPGNLALEKSYGTYSKKSYALKAVKTVKKSTNSKKSFGLFIDNFEDLREIVNCSKLKTNALHLLDSRGNFKWGIALSTKRKLKQNGLQGHKNKIGKISRKRIRSTSKSNTDSELDKRRKFFDPSEEKGYISTGEYDIIHSDEVSDLEEPKHTRAKKLKLLSKRNFYELPGIIKLQEGLFKLLRNFLLILPDSSVSEVLTHYIKLEILLVLSNHKHPGVRASIVKLISALCDRLPTSELQIFSKKYYWHHLANQLSLNPVDTNLFEACMQWITGTYHSLEEYLQHKNLVIIRKYGLNTLIALLPQTLSNINLAVNAFEIVENLFKRDPSSCSYFIENGLIQSSVKTLYRLYMKLKPISNNVDKSITNVLIAIAEKSVKSAGQINILWEVLNLLSANQDSDILSVTKGFRSVQANVLLSALEIFLPKHVSPTLSVKHKTLHLTDSYLSPTELKTRFELLIDRSTQLITTLNLQYKFTLAELKLLEFLVSFGVSGNTKCSNFIIWGLLPSRPAEIRVHFIDTLWNLCKNNSIPPILCDGKIIQSLLAFHLLEEHQEDSNLNEITTISKLCKKLNITKNILIMDIDSDKFELIRDHLLVKQKAAIEKALYKYEHLAQVCIESSMTITRIVTELQNSERKVLMNHMKEYDENYIYNEWISVIQRMTHEGAPWFNETNYPKSWELDDTEGPSRVRVRLRRCHLNLESRFLMTTLHDESNRYIQPLEYLLTGHDHYLSFSKNSQVLYNFPTIHLPVDGEIDGELLITDEKIYFVATYHYKFYYLSYDIKSITEIWLRRYQHQEKAFEIFLDSNKSKLFALKNIEDFRAIKEIFADKIVQSPEQNKLLLITQQWKEGLLTNWEYIMTLNQLSGRTYNDLMQYPVFPWVLCDFESDYLDLTNPKKFRKFEKPIAVQHEESEMHYINNYTYISNTMTNMGTLQMKPYHYSSHYSNSGTVLHFLVRVPPFTSYFLRYQDNNFDLPDRTFHSMKTTWCLASRDSPTDVKELIPEFFCFPEMFENFEGFNFGARQSGEVVDHVTLPPWSLNNFRLFVFVHRQALESEIVRNSLHNWIDLIFGYKQTGLHAVEAINVFHPATYAEFHVSDILDPIERKAVETMVKTYGQMPKQLLKIPHPASKQLIYNSCDTKILPSVGGIRWGAFTGSPELSKPELSSRHMLSGTKFYSLLSFNQTNVVYGVPEKCCVMQGPETDIYLFVSWNHEDRLVRLQSLSETGLHSKPLLYNNPLDEITCSGSDFNSNSLWFGHKSGRISVYQCYKSNKYNKSRQTQSSIKLSYNSAFRIIPSKHTLKSEELEIEKDTNGAYESLRWLPPIVLTRHLDEVTAIALSSEFKIAVSAGRDGLAVIWDSNNFCYVRTIRKPTEMLNLPINLVAISPTLGDIITVHTMEKFKKNGNQDDECFEVTEDSFDGFVNVSMHLSGKSMMRLHSINAKYIERLTCLERIISVCYSYIKEGTGVNVIATGLENGVIKLWSSWNLAYIKEIDVKSDILSLTYSTYQHLIVLTKDNYIEVWRSDGLHGKPPMFPQITFNKINLT